MKLKSILLALAISVLAVPAMAYEAFQGPLGVLQYQAEKSYGGYVLFAPQSSKMTYLIDLEGNVINKWEAESGCFNAQLTPQGTLLRSLRTPEVWPNFGGTYTKIQEFDWNNNLIWEHDVTKSGEKVMHHLFKRLDNGNTVYLVWEKRSYQEAVAKGRDMSNPLNTITEKGLPAPVKDRFIEGIWPDAIEEVNPKGELVWKWSTWDHVGTGPDQLDINFVLPAKEVGSLNMGGPDWTHCNGIDYNPKTDKFLLNSRNFGEFFIIDRKSGKIEYRYGNPVTHQKDAEAVAYMTQGAQILFGPHEANFLENGNISVLDNGCYRPNGNYTRAVEVDPKTSKIVWEFGAKSIGGSNNSFHSNFQSGAYKLPNGNYQITATENGHIVEVTPEQELVWEFVVPVNADNKIYNVGANHGGNGNPVHKALRYSKDFAGFQGKDLNPKGEKMPNWVEAFKENPMPYRALAPKKVMLDSANVPKYTERYVDDFLKRDRPAPADKK